MQIPQYRKLTENFCARHRKVWHVPKPPTRSTLFPLSDNPPAWECLRKIRFWFAETKNIQFFQTAIVTKTF